MTTAMEGIRNFRDFGGYSAGDRMVVRGRLFRSAAPSGATADDLRRLADYGIGTVIDLRRWSERDAAPSLRPDNWSGSVVEIVERDVMEAPHERYLRGGDLSFAVLRARILEFYREAPFDTRHIDIFRRGIEAVAAADAPVLVHCAVGKDRTGLLVALIQHILGVSEADQMADYLLTTRDRRMIDDLTARSVSYAREQGIVLAPEAAEGMTSVYPDNLDSAWAAMRERYGSIDGYIAALGISERTRATLRGKYLV